MALRDIPRAPLVALGVFLLMAIPSFAEFYTDWLWFGEVGYRPVFLKSLTARSAMGSVVFLLAGAFLAFNLFVALSAVPLRNIVVVTPEGPRTISLQPRRLRPVVWLVSGLLALMLAGYASSGWSSYLAYTQAVPFGQVDPVLGRDVSYYLFQWPFLSLAQRLLFWMALLAVITTAAAYALAGNLGRAHRPGRVHHREHASPPVAARRVAAALAGPGRLAGDPAAAVRDLGDHRRPVVHRRARPHPGAAGADRGRRDRRAARGGAGVQQAAVADHARDRGLPRRIAGRHGVCHDRAAVLRVAQRAGARDAVHPAQHRGDAGGVRPRRRGRAAALGRRHADARRPRPQRRHDRQRAAVGPPAAARHVLADPGDPDLLRLRRRWTTTAT